MRFGERLKLAAGLVLKGVPASWFNRPGIEAGRSGELSSPFAKSVWVNRAIKKVSGPISAVPLEFYAGEEEIGSPELEAFWEEPAVGLSRADFIEASVGWLKLRGECFWLLGDDALVPFPAARQMSKLIVARPDRMREVIKDGELVGWEYRDAEGRPHALLPEQVIQSKCWNPYSEWRGLGEYEAAQVAAEADYAAGEFNRNLAQSNGDQGVYVVAKGGMPTDDQREQIINQLREKRQLQRRGIFAPAFLTGDIEVMDPKIRAPDADFVNIRLQNRHEIFLAFGVPPSMADKMESYSVGSASDWYLLIMETCVPTAQKLAGAIGRVAGRQTGQVLRAEFDFDEHPVLQAVRRERIDAGLKLWATGMPMEEINDYLGLGMQEFEGWDVGYLPFNVTPVGTAAPEQDQGLAEPNGTAGNRNGTNGTEGTDVVTECIKALKGRSPKTRNQRLWETHMRKRAGMVKVFEGKVRRALAEARTEVLRKLSSRASERKSVESVESVEKGLIDEIFDPEKWGTRLQVLLRPALEETLQAGADQVMEEVGYRDPWKFPPVKAVDFISSRTQAIQGVGGTVRDQLNTALKAGVEAGETMDELSDRVRGVFNGLSDSEARRIAMTESGMAFNFSRHEAMTEAGVEYKGWLSSHGPHVRPEHAAAEVKYMAEPIPIDEPFVVGGEELMYPGDESGSPGNIINCQCVQIAVAGPARGAGERGAGERGA